jgi:hypothetical protein
MKRLLTIAGLALALSLIVTGVALADKGDGDQVSPRELVQGGAGEGEKASAGEVALLLAPLVAAATAIERFIEMIFDLVEGMILSTGRLIGEGKGYLAFARQQVRVWKDAIAKLKKDEATQLTDAEEGLLRKAEEALEAAQNRVKDFLKSSPYTSWKRLISLAGGIALGVGVAFAAKLQMLAMVAGLFGGGTGTAGALGEAAKWVDKLLTGLVIGTGSAPVHSLIGLLQNTKDAVDEARALWAGSADSRAAEAYLKIQEFIEKQSVEERAPRGLRAEEVTEAEEEEAQRPPPASEIEMRRLIDSRLGRF